MALNNDQSDGIIVEQRIRGRQRASCAPKGVVPEVITLAVGEYEPLFEAVAQDLDGVRRNSERDFVSVIASRLDDVRRFDDAYYEYISLRRAMRTILHDPIKKHIHSTTEPLSDMSDTSLNRHQIRADVAENRRMKSKCGR